MLRAVTMTAHPDPSPLPHALETGDTTAAELPARAIFPDGQRCDVFVRSETNEDGKWHNALVFRRSGRVLGEPVLTGVEWHLPPHEAVARAQQLDEKELIELLGRAMRPRAPLL